MLLEHSDQKHHELGLTFTSHNQYSVALHCVSVQWCSVEHGIITNEALAGQQIVPAVVLVPTMLWA